VYRRLSQVPSDPRYLKTEVKNRVTVEVGRFVVSNDANTELVTFALGSCVAVILHDPTRCAGGMIHFRLPLSSADPDKARAMPGTFADTGIPALFRGMYALGCDKRDLVIKLAGGAAMNGDRERFDIGARNLVIARRILWQSRLLVAAEAVGDSVPRTVYLDVQSGRCIIGCPKEEFDL
jgi:chemotaxis protein CheD